MEGQLNDSGVVITNYAPNGSVDVESNKGSVSRTWRRKKSQDWLPLADAYVGVVIGAPGRRTSTSKLRITERGERGGYSGDQEGDGERRPGVLPSHRPDEDIHPGSDGRPDSWSKTNTAFVSPIIITSISHTQAMQHCEREI